MASNSRSPAAVGETLRVVRVSRRISSLAPAGAITKIRRFGITAITRRSVINQSLNTNRSANWIADCALAACHEIGELFQFSVIFRKANQIDFVAA